MKLNLENNVILLSEENNNIRVKSEEIDILLPNQTILFVKKIIQENFAIVNNHYKLKVKHQVTDFDANDIDILSVKIVLHFLYMYNLWRVTYKNKANQDLIFNEKDFENASTWDIIIMYYKKKYPFDFEYKCIVLLGVTDEKFQSLYAERQQFYNK